MDEKIAGYQEPAPAGAFNLCLRLYSPKAEALDRRWCHSRSRKEQQVLRKIDFGRSREKAALLAVTAGAGVRKSAYGYFHEIGFWNLFHGCLYCILVAGLILPSQARGGEQRSPSPAENRDQLIKEAQNPVASLISMRIQENWNFNIGSGDRIFCAPIFR